MRVRDPLDPLQLHEVPREPQTPWIWIIAALIGAAVLLWMLLSMANQPEPGDVRAVDGIGLTPRSPRTRIAIVDGAAGRARSRLPRF